MPVALNIKAEGFKEAELALAGIKGAYPTVAARAINRALVTGRKVIAQAVGARYNIKGADVKNKITDHKATKATLAANWKSRAACCRSRFSSPAAAR